MKIHEWDPEKNKELKKTRNICFDDIVFHLDRGGLVDIIPHPNRDKYPHQRIYVVEIEEYIFLVPFVETDDMIFMKTIIPSRKATREYRKRGRT
jgi:uncharacterized DUF497 family protein